ncbi:MAG TPA: GTPase Era, partial [Thermoanaerobaculia bacterium]
SDLALFDEIIPISAAKGEGTDELKTLFFDSVEEGDPIYPTEDYTTQPERFFAAEIIREKVLRHTAAELPYTTAVSVERWEDEEDSDRINIFATIYVERDTQKPIVIGKQGSMIKTIGSEARADLEAILGAKIYLDLHVSVHQGWRDDQRFLGELEWPLGEE